MYHDPFYLLILDAPGVPCCERAFSNFGENRAIHCSGFSCCRSQALGVQTSVVVPHGLSCSWHVESSWTRD